ncbi:hypothetical protein F511_19719 [Dorcoceras hygrometricum]|uniref:H(+)-exporting diphosphatase n=1 Tax=Dorcoceras hygrometricum TaxID=472368 RepID=A0A2Z7D2R8_9LAMI|nr:hypothetical protein F511_19719 [Dorcoceras hygrometricum]
MAARRRAKRGISCNAPALEGLKNLARTKTPRKADRNKSDHGKRRPVAALKVADGGVARGGVGAAKLDSRTETELNVLSIGGGFLEVRLPKSQQGSNRDFPLLRGKTVIWTSSPNRRPLLSLISPPPPPLVGICSGQLFEEFPSVLISSGLLVQTDEGTLLSVVDLIRRNLLPPTVKSQSPCDSCWSQAPVASKGFAIGSAALVSLALFGAFVSRAEITTVDVLTPKVFIGLIVGAMLPYWFSAMTMKSVGSAALKMVEEVRRQFNTIPGLMEGRGKPDYATCVKISTDASIKEMIPPGALVMLTPLIVGILFGVETLSGVLAGSLVSGVQIAISASNTGGAWDNAKKYIEAGASEHARTLGPKGSEPHKAAVIGDTIGDPLKDTSGPSLNILIKLMAVESLVFAPFFATHGGLLFKI